MSKQNIAMSSWGERVKHDLANLDVKLLGRVGVLLGGRSGEREISLMSGGGVLEALRSKGVDAHPFDPGLRCPTELAKEKFDRVFISWTLWRGWHHSRIA
jgi:D-alanine-D-alanine ligase